MTLALPMNSADAVQARLTAGRIPRFGPVLMLLARSGFILLAQGLTFLIFLQLKVPNPTVEIRNWWPVYGTLVDLGCLGLLIWLTRREGIRLFDLIGLVKSRLKVEIPWGVGLYLLLFPLAIMGGGMLAQWLVYGKLFPTFPDNTYLHSLPVWALLYSRLLWWPIWSATEELTYNGYALPRLLAQTGSRWKAVALVVFFFALQHSFLMLADPRFGLYSFLTFIPLSLGMVLVYLRLRRLTPLIVAHWLMDLSSVLLLYQAA